MTRNRPVKLRRGSQCAREARTNQVEDLMKLCRYLMIVALLGLVGVTWAGTSINYVPLPTSHHFERTGKGLFYHKEYGGLELLTNVPFEQLQCKNCHHKSGKLPNGRPIPYAYAPSCEDCHNFYEQPSVKSPDVCLECHTRQGAEAAYFKGLPEPKNLDWQDVHFRKDMTCISCHTGDQLHSSAGDQRSMLDPNGTDARCEDCHQPGRISAENHALHGDRVACAACHIKSVFTCNNCHFETELAVQGKLKRPTGQERDFIMLVNLPVRRLQRPELLRHRTFLLAHGDGKGPPVRVLPQQHGAAGVRPGWQDHRREVGRNSEEASGRQGHGPDSA
jgi:hypothetical protein